MNNKWYSLTRPAVVQFNPPRDIAEGLTNRVAFGTTELHVIRPACDLDREFLFYLSISHAFRKLGEGEMYGAGGQKRVPESFLLNFRNPLPPLDEQRAIAAFLDREVSRIDSLVAKKRRLIELLKEKRTALISHAVTKGLNADAHMKPSGIDWIGNIPEGWSTIKLRFVASVTTGDKDTVNRIPDGQYPFFVRAQTVERINTYAYDGEAVLTAGDGVGVAKVFHYANGKFDYHQRVYKFSDFQHLSGRFFFHYIRAQFYKEVIKNSAKSTVDSLRLPMIKDFTFCKPPSKEQDPITSYIDHHSEQIDQLITKAEAAIEKVHEYRSALISAAVTGKIDVRDKVRE